MKRDPDHQKRDGDTNIQDRHAQTRRLFRYLSRNFLRQLKDVIPGLIAAGALVLPATAVLAASGVRTAHEFIIAIGDGTPGPTMALAMLLFAGTAGTFVVRHHHTVKKQEEALEKVSDHLVNQVQQKTARIEALEYKVRTLTEQISSGGHEEDDRKEFWTTKPGTTMTTYRGMFNKEVREVGRPDGHLEFEATEWAENLLRRITVGTAVYWKIVVYIPHVESAFDHTLAAQLPARKLLYLLDYLTRLGVRRGKEITLSHIRISVVRRVEPRDEHRSIFAFTRETNDGPEELVITYHRPPTSRVPDYNGGKVTVYRGEADRKLLREAVDGYFYGGIQMTLDEFRRAVDEGSFPDEDEIVGHDDHLSIRPRYR